MIELGEFKVYPLSDGMFYLDAGQMFGAIPKVLWSKDFEADEMNRIALYLRPVLVDTGEARVLIDAGVGDRYDDKFAKIYQVKREKSQLILSLEANGFSADDVTHVILSHLHFDHCGGLTYRDEQGVSRLTFPNALFFVPAGEWEAMNNVNEKTKASYKLEWFEPVVASGKLRRISGAEEEKILPGFSYLKSPGHVADHRCVLIQSKGMHLIYWGDLIPFRVHLRLPWIASLDTHPLDTLESKKKLIKRSLDEGWHYHYFYHEEDPLSSELDIKEFLGLH